VKIAVLEFLCGGGLIGFVPSPSKNGIESQSIHSLAGEGLLMLNALIADLVDCGHSVSTCFDPTVIKGNTPIFHHEKRVAASFVESHENWIEKWIEIGLSCDQTIVIAPELDHHLATIVADMRLRGVRVVACSDTFLQATSDKLTTAQFLSASQVSHPPTWTLADIRASKLELEKRLGSGPVTLKRRDGAGCSEMKYFASIDAFTRWSASTMGTVEQEPMWLVQPWLTGQPASLALIAGHASKLLGVFGQTIEIEFEQADPEIGAVVYRGGTELDSRLDIEIFREMAVQVIDSLPGEKAGWIGIDFLVPLSASKSSDLIVIEINPRLTTSYLGYRQRYGHELANAIIGLGKIHEVNSSSKGDRITFIAN
jgi:predicted ATP-grasp superfamily ATP-dependent carboligase